MEKQKNKSKPKKPSLKLGFVIAFAWIPLMFGIAGLIILPVLLIVPLMGDGQIHQTFLPEELRPTAEYVLNTVPLDEPIELADGVSVQIVTTGFGENTICFDVGVLPDEPNYPRHSRIFVNGVRVYGARTISLAIRFGRSKLCVEGELESGLHLLEFHLRDSSWGEPIAIQQWAIEIP